jgi:hypothetical protein
MLSYLCSAGNAASRASMAHYHSLLSLLAHACMQPCAAACRALLPPCHAGGSACQAGRTGPHWTSECPITAYFQLLSQPVSHFDLRCSRCCPIDWLRVSWLLYCWPRVSCGTCDALLSEILTSQACLFAGHAWEEHNTGAATRGEAAAVLLRVLRAAGLPWHARPTCNLSAPLLHWTKQQLAAGR